jgi:VWFA-related protein
MKRWALLFVVTAESAQESTFRTQTREVYIPISVMTKDGRPVEGLTRQDFLVSDNGEPQDVRMVERDSVPLPVYAVLVLQIDEGSGAALAKVQKTASVVSSYISNDLGINQPSLTAVVGVSDEVAVMQNFSPDPNVLRDTFGRLSGKGTSNRLIDGVNLACDLLSAKQKAARRMIVMLGESHDSQSKATFRDVVVKAQREDVVIYTISYSAFTTAFTQRASQRPPAKDEPGLYDPSNHGGMDLLAIPALLAQLAKTNVAEAFAQSTGGSHQKFTTLHGLEAQLTLIGNELHNRYTLTFVPSKSQTVGYHELSVSVAGSRDLRIHSRAGYWLDSKPGR